MEGFFYSVEYLEMKMPLRKQMSYQLFSPMSRFYLSGLFKATLFV